MIRLNVFNLNGCCDGKIQIPPWKECEKKDTSPPIVPTIALDTADKSPGNNKTPTITGTAEAGSTVTIKTVFDRVLGTTTTDSNGVFSIKSSTLDDGSYTLFAIATDSAGNTSFSSSLVIEIDTFPPARPTIALDTADRSSGTYNIIGELEDSYTNNNYYKYRLD